MSSPSISNYRIGIVCALPKEMAAVLAVLDEEHKSPTRKDPQDDNTYILGRIHEHDVVIACLPAGTYGTNSAATVAKDLLRTFFNVRIGLMVGIGGGVPNLPKDDIRLGDVVMSQPDRTHGGVVQYDLGKSLEKGMFERKGSLDRPPKSLLTALSASQARNRGISTFLQQAYSKDLTLTERGYDHPGTENDQLNCNRCGVPPWWWKLVLLLLMWLWNPWHCEVCDNGQVRRKIRKHRNPVIHYGTIASGNRLIKVAEERDQLGRDLGAKCVEMEAAGLMNDFRCVVIRGICDYADSYKNDEWQEYAALTAAACAKELLSHVVPEIVNEEEPLKAVVSVLEEQVSTTKELLDETKQQGLKIETRYHNDLHRKCHQALKTTTYEEYKNINPERVPGTCQWTLEHEVFCRWRTSRKDDLLWISADPGCGKSVLARYLIDSELQSDHNHEVCYFFFKDNQDQNSLSAALCAILHQIFAFAPHLMHHAMAAWEKNGDKPITREIDEMWRILLAAVKDAQAPKIVCVFDALDECRETDRKNLINKLTEFYKQTSSTTFPIPGDVTRTQLRFLVTSRPYDDIRYAFQLPSYLPSIQLRGEEENDQIHQEINMVIKKRVEEVATKLSLKQQTRDRLETELLNMEHRTYLWLHLAIASIYETFRDSFRPDEESIRRLPTGIEDAYEKILSKASKERQNVKLVLQIIVGAKRPLTVGEMAVALGVASKPEVTTLKDAILDVKHLERQVRHWCGLFVFVSDSRIYLIHQTAKEFLVRRPDVEVSQDIWKHCLEPVEFESVMAHICTGLLVLGDVGERVRSLMARIKSSETVDQSLEEILSQEDDIRCFIAYSAASWASHLQNTDPPVDKVLKTKALKLYDTHTDLFDWWFTIFWRAVNRDRRPDMNALCLAALNGHKEFVHDFLRDDPSSVNFSDGTQNTAIIWASEYGHLAIVELLLSKGADVNARGGYGRTALEEASGRGHIAIVELLLSKGADVNARGGYRRTALVAASGGGHIAIVELLLSKGADVNDRGKYETALEAASRYGYQEIADLLISHGAEEQKSGSDTDEEPMSDSPVPSDDGDISSNEPEDTQSLPSMNTTIYEQPIDIWWEVFSFPVSSQRPIYRPPDSRQQALEWLRALRLGEPVSDEDDV